MAKSTISIFREEVPTGMAALASKRTEGIRKSYLHVAMFSGKLDTEELALSCYLQGVRDVMEMVDHRPEFFTKLIEETRTDGR